MKFGMRSMFKSGDVPFIGSDDMYHGKVFNDPVKTPFEEWYNESLGYAFRSEMIIADISPGNPEALKEYLYAAYKAGQQQMIDQVHDIMRHTIMD